MGKNKSTRCLHIYQMRHIYLPMLMTMILSACDKLKKKNIHNSLLTMNTIFSDRNSYIHSKKIHFQF